MNKPIDWNDDRIDYLRVNIEVPDEYARCRQCTDGECKSCDYLKEKGLSDVLSNIMRPRISFPF